MPKLIMKEIEEGLKTCGLEGKFPWTEETFFEDFQAYLSNIRAKSCLKPGDIVKDVIIPEELEKTIADFSGIIKFIKLRLSDIPENIREYAYNTQFILAAVRRILDMETGILVPDFTERLNPTHLL